VADAPWRCSQCGTVNEPVANACRTCGRWPSLFELEGSTIESDVPLVRDDVYEARTVDVGELEPEVFEPDVDDDVDLPTELETDDEDVGPPKPAWQRFARLIVPIGVVLYILITAIANRGSG
jgi:predicted  nucleic acid-binding Zn-ribbon protein